MQELELKGYIQKRVGIGTIVLKQSENDTQKKTGIYFGFGNTICRQISDFSLILDEHVQKELKGLNLVPFRSAPGYDIN